MWPWLISLGLLVASGVTILWYRSQLASARGSLQTFQETTERWALLVEQQSKRFEEALVTLKARQETERHEDEQTVSAASGNPGELSDLLNKLH